MAVRSSALRGGRCSEYSRSAPARPFGNVRLGEGKALGSEGGKSLENATLLWPEQRSRAVSSRPTPKIEDAPCRGDSRFRMYSAEGYWRGAI
jgi:hypothetical protein